MSSTELIIAEDDNNEGNEKEEEKQDVKCDGLIQFGKFSLGWDRYDVLGYLVIIIQVESEERMNKSRV